MVVIPPLPFESFRLVARLYKIVIDLKPGFGIPLIQFVAVADDIVEGVDCFKGFSRFFQTLAQIK